MNFLYEPIVRQKLSACSRDCLLQTVNNCDRLCSLRPAAISVLCVQDFGLWLPQHHHHPWHQWPILQWQHHLPSTYDSQCRQVSEITGLTCWFSLLQCHFNAQEYQGVWNFLTVRSWQSCRWWFQPLRVYVRENTDPAGTAYRLAKIDLLPLMHNEAIEGTFKLRRVCVVLSWFVLSTERPKHFGTVHGDSQRQKS